MNCCKWAPKEYGKMLNVEEDSRSILEDAGVAAKEATG